MKNFSYGSRVAVCVITMACASGAALGEEASSAEAGWAAITKCAAIKDADARHTCSDDVLRNAGLLPATETKAVKERQSFGLQRPAPREAPKEADEATEVTLASVEQGGDGKLVLTTTEGAVWHQVESDSIRPVPSQGQTMKIAKTSFGGFMCEPVKRVAFRCFRAR